MPIPTPVRKSTAPYEAHPLQDFLSRTAERLPDKVAIIDGDRKVTYRELQTYSDQLASALASMGIGKGDRIGLLAPNCIEFEVAFYGIVKAGAIASTLNSGYREREIAHQLNNSQAEVLIVHQALLEMAKAAKSDIPALKQMIVIKEDSTDADSFWGLIEASPASPPDITVDPMKDLVALPYSSGTTGLPKGVMLTHHNLTSNTEQLIRRPGEAFTCMEDDVVLIHLPLFHIYGMNVLMNPFIAVGATQVMMGRFDMEDFLKLLSSHKVTALFSVPPVGLGLSQYPGVSNYDLSSIKVGLFGAAPLSTDLQTRIQNRLGFPIIQGYGMTEASPLTNLDFIEPDQKRPGSIGPATADTEQKVVDVEDPTKDMPYGESGELMIRGPQIMQGYYNDPVATAETLTPDGWLHTGDIVRMDEDGYVWVLDRKKELIKYKGFQVPPAELEGLLLEHPSVADAAVIGKADEESGEIPKAFIVCKEGQEASAVDIMEFVASRVSTFKHIREVEFVDSIPKNPSGKILRRVLVEQERAKSG